MKKSTKILALAAFACMVTSIVGVSASWSYAERPSAEVDQELGVKVSTFLWQGAEELPDNVKGEHHRELIEQLVNGENGMNTSGSEINAQIKERQDGLWSWDTFGSMDTYDDEMMTNMFGLDVSALSFMIYFPDSTPNTRYIFTTNVDLGQSGTFNNAKPSIPIGENIYVIYRTTIELIDGKWKETLSEAGYAESAYYDNNLLGSWVVKCPAFDVETWKAGRLGTGFNDAIRSFVGQENLAYLESATEKAYYTITPTSGGTMKITSTNPLAKIEAYDKNKKKINATQKEVDGKQTLSFSVTANQVYYFALSGDTDIEFNVTL